MKSSISKRVSLGILLILLVSFIQMPIFAYTEDSICLYSNNGEYIIYVKDVLNEEFEFAFSDKKDESEDNLEFISSELDSSKDAINVAYVNNQLLYKYFLEDSKSYMFVRNSKGEMVVSGDEINLDDTISNWIVDYVSSTTKRIETKVDSETLVDTTEAIKDTELSLNTVRVADYLEIVPKDGASYEYYLVNINDSSDAKALFDMAEEMNSSEKDMYNSLVDAYDFYRQLSWIEGNIEEWTPAEDNKIYQPIESETGDKYLVIIKEDTGEDMTFDAKFMISKEHDELKYKNDLDKIIHTIVKLPVTGESLALVIGFVVVIAAIVVVLFLRKKSNKESK